MAHDELRAVVSPIADVQNSWINYRYGTKRPFNLKLELD